MESNSIDEINKKLKSKLPKPKTYEWYLEWLRRKGFTHK